MTEFEQIYARYFKDVYKYALSLTRSEALAEEITQETFFKALKGIHRFDGRCKVYVWLCQIAKNTYFTMRKKESKTDENVEALVKTEDTLEQRLLIKESAYEIHQILHRLSEPYKEVFSLRVFGELSFQQIGELFGKSESWARVTYHRAKIKIKEGLS